MSKDKKNDLTFCDVEHDSQNVTNLSLYHKNLSVNSQNLSLNAAILSLICDITNKINKLVKNIKNCLFFGSEKKGCNRGDYPFLGSFLTSSNNGNDSFTSHDNKRYYRVLSKLISDLPSRKPLAFFVPDNSAASQAVTIHSSMAPQAHLSATRGQTIISKVSNLLTDYDGLTLQNTIAERRICGAVSNKTESKTRHPILLPYSVAFTQNLLGVIHHG
ncbi:hypothetical protein ACT3QR_09595 [Psychrobacter sp. AOP7-B1-25]|uniref:hypothetical protein n=1 Tax=Psychrobacter sp. AOP7-B1-25 TaxID=3457644 RepID=UPI00402B7181